MKRQPLRKIPIKKSYDTWCRSDSEISLAFADELEKRFQPFGLASREDVEETLAFLDAPSPNALPIQHVSPEEVCLYIQKLHPRKAPGFDGIDSRIAKALPKKGILFLVLLFNSMLRIHHFPSQWKCAVITMIPKPGKPENLVQSYRPISLLPTFSKIFERIFLSRIMGVRSVPFSTTSLVLGIITRASTSSCPAYLVFKNKQYSSAIFLDVKEAFDRVWQQQQLAAHAE